MRAEIISVGTELLLGQITDTNASYLAGELPALGIDLFFISQVGDNLGRLVDTLRRAMGRADLTIMTGGLGPTEDDVTREAIAAMMGEEMVVSPQLESDLRAFFGRRNRPFTPNNLKQATLIPSASAIANPVGTAPGWWVEKDGRIIVAMPGVPREMYRMWGSEVVPHLRAHKALSSAVIVSRTMKLIGIGESLAEDKIRGLLASTNPTIGTYAKQDGIHLRLTSKAASVAEARAAIAIMEQKLQDILGAYVYGYDGDTPASVVGDLLLQKGQTLAIMETVTGGHISSSLMEDQRYPAYFKSGYVAPTPEALAQLGVAPEIIADNGMASLPLAEAMAIAARERCQARMGLGICGVLTAGAGADAPPGAVHVALNDGETRTSSLVFPTIPAEIRRWGMLTALNLIRLRLLGEV